MKQHLAWVKNNWVLVVIGILVVSLFFNEGFRLTFARKRAIRKAQTEYAQLEQQNAALAKKIHTLESHPATYESLVRRDLGYLRPGEKEVRFLKSKSST